VGVITSRVSQRRESVSAVFGSPWPGVAALSVGREAMPKRSVTLKVAGACTVLAVAATVAWLATMPYPIQLWWGNRAKVQYTESWPISYADYRFAKRVAASEMHFREIFWAVSCSSSNEIIFTTLERWSGPLAASGRTITVKRVGNRWQIPGGVWSYWIS